MDLPWKQFTNLKKGNENLPIFCQQILFYFLITSYYFYYTYGVSEEEKCCSNCYIENVRKLIKNLKKLTIFKMSKLFIVHSNNPDKLSNN